MVTLTGAVFGGLFAWLGVQMSMRTLEQFDGRHRRVCQWLAMALTGIGGLTGLIVVSLPLDYGISVLAVTGLLVIQTPIDLVERHLWRTPTLVVFGLLLCARSFEVKSLGWQAAFVLPMASVAGFVGLFATVNRVSPQSLGWGDVLLVAPLAFGLSIAKQASLFTWLITASATSVLHGVLVLRRGEKTIPFGPHLLFGAWLGLVVDIYP